jgi:hypothetical protein
MKNISMDIQSLQDLIEMKFELIQDSEDPNYRGYQIELT